MADHERFRIGNQTALSAPGLMDPFHYAIASGFKAFEWFPDRNATGAGWDESSLDRNAREYIRETAIAHDIRLSVHAPWQANPLTLAAHPLLLRQLDFACDIGANILNIHLYTESGPDAYVDAILPLVSRLAETDIALSIENTPLTTPVHFNELFGKLRSAVEGGTSHIGMCLDVGHANLCGVTRNDYLRYLDELHEQVTVNHVHLHENWGDRDSHLTLFTGPARTDSRGIEGLLRRLEKRRFSGSMILEQWPEPPTLLSAARDQLNSLLTNQSVDTHSRVFAEAPQAPEFPSSNDEAKFVSILAEGNAQQRSWREKLEFVRSLVGEEPRRLSLEELVYLAAYLRFLGTGEVTTVEDGRHFRPNHAARVSIEIQDQLAKITDPAQVFVLRKILPWLPSSGHAFTTAEPLTRIRDIAHRNDIPQDLKREIKTTLQNKLHRCAGPEDLVTSTAILARITAPGSHYSPDFVEQFKIFQDELKEFFNARSLEDQLRSIADKGSAPDGALIRRFLEKRERIDEGIPRQVEILWLLTELRHSLAAPVEENPGSETQQLRLADVALERFGFVLLSRIINGFERLTFPQDRRDWIMQLEALRLTVANVALSGFSAAECHVVDHELSAWRESFTPADSERLLRLKATVDRSRRLAEEYSDQVMALFSKRAAKLGRALGVADSAIQAFVEGDIRGHMVFQLSKLASALLAAIRNAAGLPAHDVVVPGIATGQLLAADSLDSLRNRSGPPMLILLKDAQGDEEIPRVVAGVILAHVIPHLSHLAVRARQARVVFICCEDAAEFAKFAHLNGKWVVLDAGPHGASLQPAGHSFTGDLSLSPVNKEPESTHLLEVSLDPVLPCIPLDQVAPENGGHKAAAVRRLEALSQNRHAGFLVPAGVVIPFGFMEQCLRSQAQINTEYLLLRNRIDSLSAEQFKLTSERLRILVGYLHIPEDVIKTIAQRFSAKAPGNHMRFMVRSSSNCEDLTELAGAGLYESIANVPPAQLGDAVRRVWMSLWTERAAFSRRQSGIPHDRAHMAVLVQGMVVPDYSFILHTVNPITRNHLEVYAELAVGLGETLASAAVAGSPYRMVCHKQSGEVRILAFANISYALEPGLKTGIERRLLDYSTIRLSTDREFVKNLGRRLAAIARFVEDALHGPQDIEGMLAEDRIYLVQSRPQQGLE